MFLESLLNNPKITCLFFLIPKINEDIIHNDDNKNVQILLEHSVNQIHESYKSIC